MLWFANSGHHQCWKEMCIRDSPYTAPVIRTEFVYNTYSFNTFFHNAFANSQSFILLNFLCSSSNFLDLYCARFVKSFDVVITVYCSFVSVNGTIHKFHFYVVKCFCSIQWIVGLFCESSVIFASCLDYIHIVPECNLYIETQTRISVRAIFVYYLL